MNPRRNLVQHPRDDARVASVAVHISTAGVQTSRFSAQFAHGNASRRSTDSRVHPLAISFLERRAQFQRIILGGGEGMLLSMSLQELTKFGVTNCSPGPTIDESTCAWSWLVNTRAPLNQTWIKRHDQKSLEARTETPPRKAARRYSTLFGATVASTNWSTHLSRHSRDWRRAPGSPRGPVRGRLGSSQYFPTTRQELS
jgi:hypothetical protein